MSTTSASTSRGKRRKRKTRTLDPLRLIRVTDHLTGTLLFERIYEWADQTNTSNLGSLVQSFFQFAREVEGGDVESVYFEECAVGLMHSATPRSMGSSEHRAAMTCPMDSMKLIKARTDDVVVVLFHECPGPEQGNQEVFSQFVNAAASEFTKDFGAAISSMRGSFSELNDAMPDYISKLDKIQSVFDGFTETVDRLRFNLLRPVVRPDSSFKSLSLDEDGDDRMTINLSV